MVELFVAKYINVKPIKREAKPGAQLYFSGKIVKRNYYLNHVEVFYEPLPTPPELSWLRELRPYDLPKESRRLRPVLQPPLLYADGSVGQVDVGYDGSFKTPVRMYKDKPGIYTIVAWVTKDTSRDAFPATEVCIKVQ